MPYQYLIVWSSVLAWRIPGTGEPGGLPSMGSHGVGHDWSDLAAAAAAISIFNSLVISWGYGGQVLGFRIGTKGFGQKDIWPFSCGSEHVRDTHTQMGSRQQERKRGRRWKKSVWEKSIWEFFVLILRLFFKSEIVSKQQWNSKHTMPRPV